MPSLILYHMPSCPYCAKVRRFLEVNKISVPLKDTAADANVREELRKIGGKTQVPCLVIDGRPMYESNDIIEWFKTNYLGK